MKKFVMFSSSTDPEATDHLSDEINIFVQLVTHKLIARRHKIDLV